MTTFVKMPLVDSHGRKLHKLRVQLTDACNYRCVYCMPEDMRFHAPRDLLTPEEIENLCLALHGFGVDEIRLTGGEPLIRPEFETIVTRLARIPWARFGLTTNGSYLASKLDFMADVGLTSVNVSLDTLQADRFANLTRRGKLAPVLDAILAARRRDFSVKVNCIVFRGLNDDELLDFARFSEQYGIEVRFLELMKVGPGQWNHADRFVAADTLIERLQTEMELIPVTVPDDATAFVYRTPGGGRLGFIASESRPFCGSCSRLRLTATGQLRACLFSEEGVQLRGADPLDIPDLLHALLPMKPTHRLDHIHQPMNQIGG
jgi:GTP 3',8-cyclase